MDHGIVRKWLREVVQPYNDADRVFVDVDRTLVAVSSLSPKTEVYTYDDGRTQLLLLMSGTVPINYRGATYNIPIDVWVPRLYPREPPIVYVRPTNEMLIRKGKNVDPSGRVGGEYVERWERKWESCNLLELIHSCQAIFGQEPPVYAKPKQTHAVSPPVASTSRSPIDLRDRRPPPPPQQQQQLQSQKQQQQPQDGGPPARPARPASSFSGYDGGSFHASPPPPTHHAAAGWPASPRLPQTNPANYHEAYTNGTSWERGSDGRTASWHQTADSHSPTWTRQSLDRSHRSASVQSDNPPQRPRYEVAPPAPISATLPAPARPPNPELLQMHAALYQKIQARLQHLRSTVGESQHQLRLLIGDLDRGEPAIQDEMARLEAVKDVCKATGDGLEEAVSSGKRRIEELRDRSEPDVDGMICATSIVGNQLIDLVASDSAIGDVLFYLGQALHSEAIEVERYLKQTRFLAREQFMRRALAQKITQGMGW